MAPRVIAGLGRAVLNTTRLHPTASPSPVEKIPSSRLEFRFRRGDHAEAMTDAGHVDAVVTVGAGMRGFVELELRDFGPIGTADQMAREARAVPA